MKALFIVEPDPVLLASYAELLASPDYSIYLFRTASKAIKQLDSIMPSVVVLELALPVHNGFEFLYELHSYSDTRSVRVVVNSFIQENDIPFGFLNRGDLHIADYLYKPFTNPEKLREAVYAV